MNQKVLLPMWNNYKKIIPKDTSQTQFQETKRAFYGGCSAIFALLINDVCEMAESEAEEVFDCVRLELEQFVVQVKAGRA